jgi:GAF domain-containing protein
VSEPVEGRQDPLDGRATVGIADRMVAAARELESKPDAQSTMDASVALALREISGCDGATLSLLERPGRLNVAAHTDDDALACDLLQHALREGPCLEAALDRRIVYGTGLASDPRWPAWGPRAVRVYGINSVLCLQLFTSSETLGTLSLYSRARGAFGPQERDDAVATAAHVAVAIASARQADRLSAAIDTRTVIGQACGILMERFQLGAQQAFDVLARISSQKNVKIREIARELIDTGTLPGTRTDD